MATRIFEIPFAATGDREALATLDQPDGKVSLQAGWTPDYELPNDHDSYRPVGRKEMNGVFNEVTAAVGEMQLAGFSRWQALDGGWPFGAYVVYAGLTYRSLVENNVEMPGPDAVNWVRMGAGIATAAQAQGLLDDSVLLTPKGLDQAFGGANQTLGNPGFQRRPGGLIEQWGFGVAAATGTSVSHTHIAFGLAFPTAARFIGITPLAAANSINGYYPSAAAIDVMPSNFRVVLDSLNPDEMFDQTVPFFWWALGH